MGCLCRTFREEPLARPCVAWANPSLSVFRWVPTPPEFTSLCKRSSGGVLVANPIRLTGRQQGRSELATPLLEHSPLRGRYAPEGDPINPKGGKQ